MKKNTWLWWSSGKDSTWALHTLRQSSEFEVTALVTSINVAADRVAMHAVRRTLLEAQAAALGLPLKIIELPHPCPNGAYEKAAHALIEEAEQQGVTHMAFGDLFLEDVRDYRVKLLEQSSIEPVFPLWLQDTQTLGREMIAGGLVAHLTCIDPKAIDPQFVGRVYDNSLLDELPDSCDPCGENGEFHSFVSDGPGFQQPVKVKLGEKVHRDGFWFADLQAV